MEAAQVSGGREKACKRTLHLATGWSHCGTAMCCKIRSAGCDQRHCFLFMPVLCRDIVLGRDFLKVSGITVHMALGGWTLQMDTN